MNMYSSHTFNAPRRGVALVIVLSMLVLLSAIMVAFMGTVSSERAAQRAAYSSFEAQQAAESAVNLVISQIRTATKNDDGTVNWASQPGAIRTFGGGRDMVYKLYSATDMQESESSYKPQTPQESGYNANQPKETRPGFVDLNQPVLTPAANGAVEPHYPIVDPRAGLSWDGGFAGPGKGRVEGFWTPQTNLHFSGKKDSNGSPIMEVPMRVRWLYQLKDGTLIAADAGTNRIPGAEKDNPPVARVAFWTDDESSKLNINTAGENTYWDTPMASAYDESGNAISKNVIYTDTKRPSAALSAAQPTQGEYQRFPGHPATTNLSPALRWLYPGDPRFSASGPTVVNDWKFKEALYRLLPRLRNGMGSSMAGTIANFDDFGTQDYRIPKRDRMFSNLDEFWFRPDRSPISQEGFFGVFRTDSPSLLRDPVYPHTEFTPEVIEQLRFFLTANSRSPELNMFGLPRISIWPVHEVDNPVPSASRRSGFDDLMAFCGSIADKQYYFTRADSTSSIRDFESGTQPVPPLPGMPKRNKKLLFGVGGDPDGYLQRMGKRDIPGVGGNFNTKYSDKDPSGIHTEWERILLTMFDYIRSVNLIDTGRKEASSAGYKLAYTPGYSVTNPPNYSPGVKSVLGSGQVVPTVIRDSNNVPIMKGFGRFVNLSEVALLFYRDSATLPGDSTADVPSGVDQQDYVGIRCVLLPEMWTVSPGYPAYSEAYAYKVREFSPLKVSDAGNPTIPAKNLDLADNDFCYVDVNAYRIADGRFFMPTLSFNNQFVYDGASATKGRKQFVKPNKANTAASYANYPFYSKKFFVRKNASGVLSQEFTLEPGTLEFEFYPLAITNPLNPNLGAPARVTEPLQRVYVAFQKVTLPIPSAGGTPFQTRIQSEPTDNGRSWIQTSDTIRSMESNGSAKGDLRLIAGEAMVMDTAFSASGNKALDPTGEYFNKAVRQVHNFRNGWGRMFNGAKWNKLTPLATVRGNQQPPAYINDKVPKVAATNGSAISVDGQAIGDFDRGMAKHTDGPFINRPDEGNTRFDMSDGDVAGGGHLPYFRGGNGYEEVGETFFSPNRLLPSAVMFGSLPTGIFAPSPTGGRGRPWETLLFAPPTSPGHRGAASPADHYMLDFFNMPVVEPYAISEPLSTMGKINLNSRLAPFGYVQVDGRSYIQRYTGLMGVFKGVKQFLIPNGMLHAGHQEGPLKEMAIKLRYDVDYEVMVDKYIDGYLDSKGYFKYASQICELDLPLKNGPGPSGSPTGTPLGASQVNTIAARKAFLNDYQMSGDNTRERPYAHIYPRLTTKSNVFTVHVWAQSIAKNPSTKGGEWDQFDETRDRILGEYRGSTTIERYIDGKEEKLNDYDAVENSNAKGLDPYYRFRILNSKRFTPQ